MRRIRKNTLETTMSLTHDVSEIVNGLNSLQKKAKEQQLQYHQLLQGIVGLHQKHRIAKNYAVSDELRELLNSVGVKIVQGTAQYGGYENIPENLRNMPGDDYYQVDADLLRRFLNKVSS